VEVPVRRTACLVRFFSGLPDRVCGVFVISQNYFHVTFAHSSELSSSLFRCNITSTANTVPLNNRQISESTCEMELSCFYKFILKCVNLFLRNIKNGWNMKGKSSTEFFHDVNNACIALFACLSC
jgi:hypothetical protein